MSNQERISLREYGRRIGTSDTAVRKAIKAEKIVQGVVYDDKGKPWIIPDVANAEWSKSYDPSYQRVTQSGTPVSIYADAGNPKDDASSGLKDESETPPPMDTGQARTADTSLAAARRAQAVYKAKILELEMKQKQGSLVDKQQVYKGLFVAGQEIRSAMQSIPDRVIDNILAARSRNEAHAILSNAIADALEKLADLGTREFTNRS